MQIEIRGGRDLKSAEVLVGRGERSSSVQKWGGCEEREIEVNPSPALFQFAFQFQSLQETPLYLS